MNIKFWNQPKDVTLEKILNEKLKQGFEKVWLISGMTKDDGMDMVVDSIEVARKSGTDVSVLIGVDRKNTSKDMLIRLLKLGCNLSLHINRDESKVETRIYIFENKNGESFVYQSAGKFSEGGLSENYCLIQEIIYTPDDNKIFENFKSVLIQGTQEIFKRVDEEDLKLLAEKGEIVARITERKIPRISEMYGNSSINSIANDMYDENTTPRLFDIPKNDIDIDIDIDIAGEVKKSELSAEVEAKKEKLQKESMDKLAAEKLAKFYDENMEISSEKRVSIIKDINNIDFSNIKIFVFELNKIIEKGVSEGEIRIPHYLYENMQSFFESSNEFKIIKDDKGKERFGNKIHLEILDVADNQKYVDDEALIYETDKYFALKSAILKSLRIEEKDIARLIKNSVNTFCIEIIRKDTKEYEIWENFCVYTMKNSKRKFGIM